jgi:hypothetical protein
MCGQRDTEGCLEDSIVTFIPFNDEGPLLEFVTSQDEVCVMDFYGTPQQISNYQIRRQIITQL